MTDAKKPADAEAPGTDSYDKARDMAEKALGKYAEGHPREGDQLADKALRTDRHAVEDLVEELNEDAAVTGAPDLDAPAAKTGKDKA